MLCTSMRKAPPVGTFKCLLFMDGMVWKNVLERILDIIYNWTCKKLLLELFNVGYCTSVD